MSNSFKQNIKSAKQLLGNPIAYYRTFAEIGGGVTAGLFLSQAYYWSLKMDCDWYYKSQESWTDDTGLSRSEQETAREKLRQRGLIKEKKCGIPCRLWFKVDHNQISKLLNALPPANHRNRAAMVEQPSQQGGNKHTANNVLMQSASETEYDLPASGNPADRTGENSPAITETTENTTKTTTETEEVEKVENEFYSYHGGSDDYQENINNQSFVVSKEDSEKEFNAFLAVALKTCEIDVKNSFVNYLKKVVRELMDEGFTAEDAEMVHTEWYSNHKNPPSIKHVYKPEFELLLAKQHKAQARLREFKRNKEQLEKSEADMKRWCEESVQSLKQERQDAGLPPIHCYCKDEQGGFLPAIIEGHQDKELSWFRCHSFKWNDDFYRRAFHTECGFEMRAKQLDNLASQPDTPSVGSTKFPEPKKLSSPHPISAFNDFDIEDFVGNNRMLVDSDRD